MPVERKSPAPTITGDVVVAPVSMTRKGGSLAAVLQKPIRGNLGEESGGMGAKLDLAPDLSCVLVVPEDLGVDEASGVGRRLHIQRISPGRFVIDLGDDEGVRIDPVIRMTLGFVEELAKQGRIGGMDAAQTAADLQEMIDEVDEAISSGRRKLESAA